MLVRDLMKRSVLTVDPDTPVSDLFDLMVVSNDHGAAVVDTTGRLMGIVTEEDVFFGTLSRPFAMDPAARATASVRQEGLVARDVMTAPAVWATEETELVEVCRVMWQLRLNRIPIVREGRVTGIVSSMDLCKAISTGAIRA